MIVVRLYARCAACEYGLGEHCPKEPHTWMGSEDLKHTGMAVPNTPEGWNALAVERPCGCRRCMPRTEAP